MRTCRRLTVDNWLYRLLSVVDRERYHADLMQMNYDVFISHASEDKWDVAEPLKKLLEKMGLRVWFDASELPLGESLRQNIDRGLSQSKFGIVVLSHAFFSK